MKKLANIPSICSRAVELGCVQYLHASLGPDPKEACSGPQNTKPHSQYETPQESGSSQNSNLHIALDRLTNCNLCQISNTI